MSVDGFYNGNNEFLIRFTPPSAGTWSYSTSSRLAPLDQQTGRLTVQPADSYRRGGIQIDSDNKLRFAYANGEGHFPIAFESDWLFALDAENSAGIGVMRNVRNAIPGKPILNIEHGGYERGPYVVFTGNYVSPEVCLERAYQCVFAGTYPTHYWQGAA